MSPLKNVINTLSGAILYKLLKWGVSTQTSNIMNLDIPHKTLIINVIDGCSASMFNYYAQPIIKPYVNNIFDDVSSVMINNILPAVSMDYSFAADSTYANAIYDHGINYVILDAFKSYNLDGDLIYASASAVYYITNTALYTVSKANDLIIYCQEAAYDGLHKLEDNDVMLALSKTAEPAARYIYTVTDGIYDLSINYAIPDAFKAYNLDGDLIYATIDGLHSLYINYITPTTDYVMWWLNQPSYIKILASNEIVFKGALAGSLKTYICSYQDIMPTYIKPICNSPIVSMISGFASNIIFSNIIGNEISELDSIYSGLDSHIINNVEIGLLGISY